MLWLAAGDPVKVDEFTRIPLFEYWAMLNNKVGEIKRETTARQQFQKNGRK
jgi:hypothetical protein